MNWYNKTKNNIFNTTCLFYVTDIQSFHISFISGDFYVCTITHLCYFLWSYSNEATHEVKGFYHWIILEGRLLLVTSGSSLLPSPAGVSGFPVQLWLCNRGRCWLAEGGFLGWPGPLGQGGLRRVSCVLGALAPVPWPIAPWFPRSFAPRLWGPYPQT